MGAFYNSICVPGDGRREIRDSLLRWLGGRGYELSREPILFDLDGEAERCAFLISNPRWTVLVFSKYEEERRLIRELQTWSELVLYVWIQDSDIWGYDLLEPHGFAASFSSDPRVYLSFADEDGRPEADPEAVCRRLGMPERAAALRRIHRRRAVFKEEICGDFCRLVGAQAALVTYDELESGDCEHLEDDWRIEQLLFLHRDAIAGGEPIDLHDDRLSPAGQASGRRLGTSRIEIPPQVLAKMERDHTRPSLSLMVLKPLSWLARSWRRLLEKTSGSGRRLEKRRNEKRRVERRRSQRPAEPRTDPTDVVEVRHLINERHRCRIRLALGGELRTVSSKPASVFAFKIGDTPVTCTARRRSKIEAVLQRPGRSKVLRDEKYEVSGLKARHLLYELPPHYLAGTPEQSYLGLHVIQTEPALYVFLYRFQRRVPVRIERAIRATVESFQLIPDPQHPR